MGERRHNNNTVRRDKSISGERNKTMLSCEASRWWWQSRSYVPRQANMYRGPADRALPSARCQQPPKRSKHPPSHRTSTLPTHYRRTVPPRASHLYTCQCVVQTNGGVPHRLWDWRTTDDCARAHSWAGSCACAWCQQWKRQPTLSESETNDRSLRHGFSMTHKQTRHLQQCFSISQSITNGHTYGAAHVIIIIIIIFHHHYYYYCYRFAFTCSVIYFYFSVCTHLLFRLCCSLIDHES